MTPMVPSDEPPSPVAYAGAVSRLAAYVIDVVAVSVTFTGGSAAAAFLVAVVTGHQLQPSSDRGLAGGGLVIWWLAYFAGCWALTSRTPGMALLGLKVVRPDGSPASPVAALIRAVTFPLSVVLFGLGFVGILLHPQRRALHDLLAVTAVVYTPARRVRRGVESVGPRRTPAIVASPTAVSTPRISSGSGGAGTGAGA